MLHKIWQNFLSTSYWLTSMGDDWWTTCAQTVSILPVYCQAHWLSCKSWLNRKFYKLLLGRITLNNMILNLIMIAYLESELYVKMIWEMAFKYLSLKGLSSWTPKTSQKFNSSFSVVIFEEKWIWKSYKNNQCYLYCKNVLSKVLLVKGISEKIGKSINDRSPYRNRNSEMISFWISGLSKFVLRSFEVVLRASV